MFFNVSFAISILFLFADVALSQDRCGCAECTDEIWGNMTADGLTCGDRITALIDNKGYTEEAACQEVSERFFDICGPFCHPFKCDDKPSFCGCQECTEQLWSTAIDDSHSTCGGRIRDLQHNYEFSEESACARISEQWPLECGPFCHPSKCDDKAPPLCGCEDCNQAVWNMNADGFTCGERILSTMSSGATEDDACRQVAKEFPNRCGPQCNPDKCDGQPLFCGCYNCTNALVNKAGDSTCGKRIDFLMSYDGGFQTEEEACLKVSNEYPKECGQCNVNICDGREEMSSSLRPVISLGMILISVVYFFCFTN